MAVVEGGKEEAAKLGRETMEAVGRGQVGINCAEAKQSAEQKKVRHFISF